MNTKYTHKNLDEILYFSVVLYPPNPQPGAEYGTAVEAATAGEARMLAAQQHPSCGIGAATDRTADGFFASRRYRNRYDAPVVKEPPMATGRM